MLVYIYINKKKTSSLVLQSFFSTSKEEKHRGKDKIPEKKFV